MRKSTCRETAFEMCDEIDLRTRERGEEMLLLLLTQLSKTMIPSKTLIDILFKESDARTAKIVNKIEEGINTYLS